MTLQDFYSNQILDFLYKYAPYIFEKAKKLGGNPKQTIRNIVLGHMKFETICVLWHKGQIIGVCNFNVNNHIAEVQDCVVRPDFRFKGILKQMTFKAIQRWPNLRVLQFSRDMKKYKGPHQIDIAKFLRISV